jgi:hypothetical protein
MKTAMKNLVWLAGLTEGEGCFGALTSWGRVQPFIDIAMSDEDVVRKAANLFGTKVHKKLDGRKPQYKAQYKLRVTGRRAVGWMMTFYPLLGMRRQERIRTVLERWRMDGAYKRNFPGLGQRLAACHPDRVSVSRGLCSLCYQRERAKRRALA